MRALRGRNRRSTPWTALAFLNGFLGITAVAGGIGLVSGGLAPPLERLSGSPFQDYTIPGLVLLFLVGGNALFACLAILSRRRRIIGTLLSVLAGTAIIGFEAVEVAVIGSDPGPARLLQVSYVSLGLAILLTTLLVGPGAILEPDSMSKRICLIQGHPDPRGVHFGHALEDAYVRAALAAGHEVEAINVAKLEFPLLRTKEDFEHGAVPDSIQTAQEAIQRADHLVILYPLWLGDMPAILKGFLEQVFRPDFVRGDGPTNLRGKTRLSSKTSRIVVTMGMPALLYRLFFGAHSVKSLKRNILGFSGIGPTRESFVGFIENGHERDRKRWLHRMAELGRRAA